MLIAAARRRVVALRQPASEVRLARALWTAWAVIVWNVVFDHVIVVAGRAYITAAAGATPFLNMDDWMRPAVTRAFWIATASGVAVFLVGVAAVHVVGAQTPGR